MPADQGEQNAEYERRWAERDAKREAFEADMRKQAEEHRQAHIEIVAEALKAERQREWGAVPDWTGYGFDDVAAIAVDALLADGVVFARMGTCDQFDGFVRDGA